MSDVASGATTSPGAPERSATELALRRALEALDDAGVPHCLRNGPGDLLTEAGSDVDVLVVPTDRRRAGRTLSACGWRRLRAPGHWGHEFWLMPVRGDHWLKLDLVWRLRYASEHESTAPWVAGRRKVGGIWLASDADVARHRDHRAAHRRERPGPLERALRRVPPRVPRGGPVLAVLGPDGAGKGLVTSELTRQLPIAVTNGYLGVGQRSAAGSGGSSRRPSPTTSEPTRQKPFRVREIAFLLRKWARTWPTLLRTYRAAWRGHVVLLDRHPLDAMAVRPTRTRWGARLEQLLATRLTPRPDAVIVLDAPGDVLFARKGEHSPELLEQWRRGYLSLDQPHTSVIDATESPEAVVAAAHDVVWAALSRRRGWPQP